MAVEASQLVSDDGCYIARRVFTSAEVYQQEKQHIFGRSWLYLAHESQFKQAGDFITTYMGETPIIVALGSDGKIHASVNSCSHRGLRVCRSDQGNAKRFVCPYHNWSFTPEGNLAAVPQERKVIAAVDKAALGLKAVPRIESYQGLIFGSMNPDIESLADYLGDMRFYLDSYFKRFPQGVEVIGAPHKWLLDANWKLPVENQLGDVGHGPYLHATLLADSPAVDEIERYGFNTVPKPGHGAAVRLLPEDSAALDIAWGMEGIAAMDPDPELVEYLVAIQEQASERIGPIGARIKGLTYGVFPNFSLLWANSTIRVSHPRGPGKVEYWSWWVVPKDAPDHIKEMLRLNYTNFFGPAGLLEQEDSDAWSAQFAGSNIDYMEDRPYYYGLGQGEETEHPELPGKVGSCYNEHYARQFYLKWREMLESGVSEQKGALS
ncbi:Rieske 2Fe-2S domain-containing protein [Parahaliea sp. F7430]|uniref:Rieske 2Fe-2S domain-containing protein n=1 Tax=Sediminihaliea albiluteola TaxID=2758564 RepID=A0A7W2TTU0_9GAMM|nr:Rieske 2Fe-2S domain-containing protein [Sediminihaliea albiluteola]MBA6411821.1 Rieske 2Fe-2S domain-containing protein [Sediminihaliea albiluteola]